MPEDAAVAAAVGQARRVRTTISLLTYEAVRLKVRGPRTPEGVPCLNITAPDLTVYNRLLGTNAEAVCA